MSSSPPPQPPSLVNLTSILTHLLPPSFPLPVDLLSTPLKTRQIYLPPPQDRMLHDGYISLNPGRGRGTSSSGSGSGSSESERSDETLIDRPKSGLISTLTNGSQTHLHSASPPVKVKVKETPDDLISLRLHAISSKLLELQNSSVHTVQGENPDSGRWVVDLLKGSGHREADQSVAGNGTWVHYQRPDEETLLARVDLRGLPIPVEQDKDKDEEKGETEHLEVFLLHEPSSPGSAVIGPDVPAQAQVGQGGEREWKLFDVRLVPPDPSADQASGRSGWVADISDLPVFARAGNDDGNGDEDGWGSDVREDDGEGEAGIGGDDFWGGYDDDDNNDDDNNNSAESLSKTGEASGSTNTNMKKNPPHLSFPSSSGSGSGSFSHPAPEPEDDLYWQSYNSVEDGLRPSNPPTPGVRTPGGYAYGTGYGHGEEMEGYYGMTSSSGSGSNPRLGGGARTPAREKDYWGTGGETPVGWSPPVREAPLPSMMDDQIDHPDDLAALEADRPVFSHVPNNAIRDRSTTITSAPITATTTTTANKGPADPAKEARQEHLRSALRALKGMYGGGEGEWDEVVREFAGK